MTSPMFHKRRAMSVLLLLAGSDSDIRLMGDDATDSVLRYWGDHDDFGSREGDPLLASMAPPSRALVTELLEAWGTKPGAPSGPRSKTRRKDRWGFLAKALAKLDIHMTPEALRQAWKEHSRARRELGSSVTPR